MNSVLILTLLNCLSSRIEYQRVVTEYSARTTSNFGYNWKDLKERKRLLKSHQDYCSKNIHANAKG